MGSQKKPSSDFPYTGPYKATRLWNDVVSAFRENIICGRHRRFMRVFEDCFSGSSATDWLLQYLKSNRNFSSDVKREKAVSLLNKLYNAGIFEEVRISKTMLHKTTVQEHRLYRLLPASPSKSNTTRLPLAPRNDVGSSHHLPYSKNIQSDVSKKSRSNIFKSDIENSKSKTSKGTSTKEDSPYQEKLTTCRLVSKVLSSSEINEVWKKMFLFRMKKALAISNLSEVLGENLVNGAFVMHNCVFLNKNGIVTNIAPADHLPQWVLSAMKCLARWPEHHEEGLPSYPGFEKDIFGVVKMYFLGLREPLIPYTLYDAITNAFVMASRQGPRYSGAYTSREKESIVQSLWTTASLENMILDLSRKYQIFDGTENVGEFQSVEHNLDKEFSQMQDDVHFMADVNDSNEQNVLCDSFYKESQITRRPRKKCLPRNANSSSGLTQRNPHPHAMRKFGSTPNLKISKYETAFGPDNCTVTRVFYQNGVSTDYGHLDEVKSASVAPIETHFSASTEDLGRCEHPVNFDRVRSLESVHWNRCEKDDPRAVSSKQLFQRSKSFATHYDLDQDVCGFSTQDFKSVPNSDLPMQQSDSMAGTQRRSKCLSKESLNANQMMTSTNGHPGTRRYLSHGYLLDKYHGLDSSYTLPPTSKSYHTDPDCMVDSVAHGHVSMKDPSFFRQETFMPSMKPCTPLHNSRLASSPTESGSHHSGYRPVLDASKERSMSVTDLTPSKMKPLRSKSSSSLHQSCDHMTSTPLSPLHRSNQQSGLRPGFSVSQMTPLLSSVGRGCNLPRREHSYMSYPQTRLSEERAKTSLQLITLLMTPSNRRKLHLLLKMMVKMTANPNLCLDPTQTTRSLVLGTFYPAIIRTEKEDDMDEMLILQLLSFMLDYYDDIFTPPDDLKTQVAHRLKEMQRPQITFSPGQPSVQYCHRISVADFEREKNTVSRQAMEDLLENIITDSKMSTKEKRKRLKQFQKIYPTIYRQRFPNPQSEALVLSDNVKPKLKQPLIAKPVNRLRGLRL